MFYLFSEINNFHGSKIEVKDQYEVDSFSWQE